MRPLAAALAMLIAGPAAARDPFLRVDRVDPARCAREGLVELAVVELELEGQLRAAAPESYRLVLDERLQGQAPRARRFAEAETPLRVALLVQHNLAYGPATPALATALATAVQALPSRAELRLILFGPEVGAVEVLTPAAAAERLGELAPSAQAGSRLVDAAGAALEALGPPDDRERRVLLLISDGTDAAPDRDAFRALGNLARVRGVPIHPIAFSPIDERGPLLNLGELAKRSRGTFRWAKTKEELGPALALFTEEMNGQLLLTFEVEDHCEASHLVQVSREELRSDVLTLPALEQPRVRWELWGLGIVGLLAALGAIALVVRRRS